MGHPTGRCVLVRRCRIVAVLILATFLPTGVLSAAPSAWGNGRSLALWSQPINLSESAGRSTFPGLQEDPRTGDVLVTWTDYTLDPYGEVMVRRRAAAGGTWAAPWNLSNWPGRDEAPALWAEPSGTIHLAWTRRDTTAGSDLLYRRWDGASWSDIQVLDHTTVYLPSPYGLFFLRNGAGQTCLFVTIGIGVSWTCLSESGWGSLAPWYYFQGLRSLGAIVLGPDGLYHAAVLGPNENASQGCDPWLSDVYYATTDGTSWTIGPNISSLGSIAYDVALAFDAQGRLHLFWSDIHPTCSYDSEQSALYERILAEGNWGPRQEVSVPNQGQALEDMTLVTDPSGWIYLAWSEGMFDASGQAVDLSIRYRLWCSVWKDEEIVYGSPEDSRNVDISLGREGGVLAVWEEGSSLAEEVAFSERSRQRWASYVPLLFRHAREQGKK